MSEVKRYGVQRGHLIEGVESTFYIPVVRASDFDAQRLRADTAETRVKTAEHDLEFFKAGKNEQFDRAEAAEQRNAELTGLLERMLKDDDMPVHWFAQSIDAALNQKSQESYIGLAACVSCSGNFGELKTYSNSLLNKAYCVACSSCGAKTSGHDKAVSAVKEWNSRKKFEEESHGDL